ncbi:hypothetical protein [Bacillus xiapuensis]|uniref:hypothetical protein n=1 Tax=Bacillus xiapuensis TaxID=2014075 RepID=UPI000C24DEF1|nr:hypothetical protein [Bacillus xiapuensis]
MANEEKKRQAANSSMAANWEEMELLGKQMEKQRTNQELKADHRQPDPIQFKDQAFLHDVNTKEKKEGGL